MKQKIIKGDLSIIHFFLQDHDVFKSKLIKMEPLNVLDVGCRVPIILFLIYHLGFQFKQLKGIDICNEQECVKNFIDQKLSNVPIDLSENEYSFYSLYRMLNNFESYEIPEIKNKAAFDKLFLQDFECIDFKNFSPVYNIKYNLVIASLFFHYFSKDYAYLYFEKLISYLDPKGILLIRMQNEIGTGNVISLSEFTTLFEYHFPEGEVFYGIDEADRDFGIFINIPGLIIL